jgi:hypothetical protein
MRLRMIGFALAGLLAWTAAPSHAAIVTFTGGTVTRLDTSTETTNNTANWDNVDYYEEDGFRLDFLPNTATLFSTNVGDYYGAGNDVIHSHWATGNFGTVTSIEITKVGGGTFDLNYFILTSNTDFGGGPASGNERAFIQGFDSLNNPTGLPQLLPVENWGFPATQIFLGAAFDAVERVVFTVENSVDCFGMDEFYIDEQAPGVVPEPASVAVWSLLGVVVGLGVYRRRGRNA